MEFTKTPLKWENKGIEPPEDVKISGFSAGYKPPASYFNYFWALASDSLSELQVKLSDYADLNDQEKEELSNEIATKLDSSEFTAEKIIEVLNAASGSSGSGLNADTLDGKDSSSFSEADHTHEEFENIVIAERSEEIPSTALLVDSNLLEGRPASYFAPSEHTHEEYLDSSEFTAENIIEVLNTASGSSGSGLNADTLDGKDSSSFSEAGHTHTSYYTGTLTASGWSSSAPYTQTVTIDGILESDVPIVDIVVSTTSSTALSQIVDWGKVHRIITANGSVTAYCYDKVPTVNLPINLMCVR